MLAVIVNDQLFAALLTVGVTAILTLMAWIVKSLILVTSEQRSQSKAQESMQVALEKVADRLDNLEDHVARSSPR